MAKPQFQLNNNQGTLAVTGDLTVQYAKELKSNLSRLLDAKGEIQLAFDEVTSFDLASVQLAYAFRREMEKRGQQVILAWPKQVGVLDLLEKTGITKML